GDRALAYFIGVERGIDRQSAATLLGAGGRTGRLGRGGGTCGGATGAAPPGSVVVFHLSDGGTSAGTRWCFVRAETLLGFLLGLALGFLFVTAAIVFVFLARFRRVTLLELARIAFLTTGRLFLGDLA